MKNKIIKSKRISEVIHEYQINPYKFIDYLKSMQLRAELSTKVSCDALEEIEKHAETFKNKHQNDVDLIIKQCQFPCLGICFNPVNRKYYVVENKVDVTNLDDVEVLCECDTVFGAKNELVKCITLRGLIEPHTLEGNVCDIKEIIELFKRLVVN